MAQYQYVCHTCHEWFYTDSPLSAGAEKYCGSCQTKGFTHTIDDIQARLRAIRAATAPPCAPVSLVLTDDDREFLAALHIASD